MAIISIKSLFDIYDSQVGWEHRKLIQSVNVEPAKDQLNDDLITTYARPTMAIIA